MPETYAAPIQGIAFSRDGKQASADDSEQRWTWNLETGQTVSCESIVGPTSEVDGSGRSPDGRRVALNVHGGIAISEAATGDEILRLDFATAHRDFTFAPDGTSLISFCELDSAIYYWPGKR